MCLDNNIVFVALDVALWEDMADRFYKLSTVCWTNVTVIHISEEGHSVQKQNTLQCTKGCHIFLVYGLTLAQSLCFDSSMKCEINNVLFFTWAVGLCGVKKKSVLSITIKVALMLKYLLFSAICPQSKISETRSRHQWLMLIKIKETLRVGMAYARETVILLVQISSGRLMWGDLYQLSMWLCWTWDCVVLILIW